MRDAKLLTRIVHGSRLYGTNTPQSDSDFKSVHVPSSRDILLGRTLLVRDNSTKQNTTVKNSKDDTDDSSYPVAKFLKLLVDGDTSGVEILLAPPQFRLQTSEQFEEILSHKNSLLNRKTKGFVGYCKSQAAKYGTKGGRMLAAGAAVELLSQFEPNHKLSAYEDRVRDFVAANPEHTSIKTITTPSGVEVPHLSVCDKLAPFTNTVAPALALMKSIHDNYGERARQAASNQNVDWKAVSHAVRIGEEAVELMLTGNLTFPRPNAQRLLEIKLGKHPFAEVAHHLEGVLEQAEQSSQHSSLPETSDMDLVESLIIKFHQQQIL